MTINFGRFPGITGLIGATGFQGVTGFQGNTGAAGPGETGIQGITGFQGVTGIAGIGTTGLVGPTGIQGVTGFQGVTGIAGLGTTGLIGPTGIQGVTGIAGTGITGLQGNTGVSNRYTALIFTHDSGVPAGGTRYLRTGQGVVCSSDGIRIDPASTISVVTIKVEASDGSRNYNVEVISNPSGSPSVLATLALSTGNTNAGGTFSAAVSSGTELGVRVVRSSGSGGSTFNFINVLVLLS